MLLKTLTSPDFPGIIGGIYNALNGNGIFFLDGPPSLEEIVVMPIICNDYRKLTNL